MKKNSHTCVKCQENYFDNEVDDYYCQKCEKEKKAIAKEVDAKLAMRPKREVKSHWKQLEEAGELILSSSGSKVVIMGRKTK